MAGREQSADLQFQPPPATVRIITSTHHPFLTEAFHDPGILKHNWPVNIFPRYLEYVITLRPVLDKFRIRCVLVAILVITPLPAALATWCSAKVEVGLAVCGLAFTLVQTILYLLPRVDDF